VAPFALHKNSIVCFMCFSLAIRDNHLASCWLSVQSGENFWNLGPLRLHLLPFFRHHTANIGLAVARSAGPIPPSMHDQQTYSRYWAQSSSTGLLLCTHGGCMVWSWCLLAVNNIHALCCARRLLLWTQYNSIGLTEVYKYVYCKSTLYQQWKNLQSLIPLSPYRFLWGLYKTTLYMLFSCFICLVAS